MGLLFRLAEFLIVLVPLAGIIIAAIRAFSTSKRPPDHPAGPKSQSLTRVLREHDRTDTRWLEYELDFARLLDFPLMTDMRDPLTVGFHKAKLRADFLRPAKAEDLLDDGDAAARYLAAVEEYVTAFNIAEAEAKRRRRTEFSQEGQQRIARAENLLRIASDAAATPQERQNAYDRARRELDGLIVLPATTQAGIERGISGELGG